VVFTKYTTKNKETIYKIDHYEPTDYKIEYWDDRDTGADGKKDVSAKQQKQTQEISPTYPPSKNGRFLLITKDGDVLVKDFRKAENFIGNEENKYFAWNIASSDYCHIAFDGNVSIFQVDVFSANPNFNIALKEAGKFFLKTLEIKESDACKINIQITPGVTSSFENAPKDYWNNRIKFAFCK
jgi:hypothetical protein